MTPTMGKNEYDEEEEEQEEGPKFEYEIEKNIDHQILNNGYPVGIPFTPPPKPKKSKV